MKDLMFSTFPLLLRLFDNSITSKTPYGIVETQDPERDLGKKLLVMCDHIQEKQSRNKNEKQKH